MATDGATVNCLEYYYGLLNCQYEGVVSHADGFSASSLDLPAWEGGTKRMLHTRARLDLKQSCQHFSTPPLTTQTVFYSELITGCLTNLSSHALHWTLVVPRICIPPWAGGAFFKTHTLQFHAKHTVAQQLSQAIHNSNVSHCAHHPPQSSAVVTLTTCGCSLPTTGTKISPHFSSTHGRHNYCTQTYAATTPVGFKPSRAEPTGLASRRHNHFAKVCRQSHDECLFLYRTTRSPSRISIRKSCPSIVLGLRMGVSLVALTWVQVFVWCGCQGKGRVPRGLGAERRRKRREAERSRRVTVCTSN